MTYGPNGSLNFPTVSGWRKRRIGTAIDTRMKAASVPMFVSDPTMLIGVNAAIRAMQTPKNAVEKIGVRHVLCTRVNDGGIKPSRDIAKNTRLCPNIITSSTVVRPAIAPSEMMTPAQLEPDVVHRKGDREGDVQFVERHDPVENRDDDDVEHRADQQACDDAEGQVAAGILRLFGGGRYRVESDVGEEDECRSAEHACQPNGK